MIDNPAFQELIDRYNRELLSFYSQQSERPDGRREEEADDAAGYVVDEAATVSAPVSIDNEGSREDGESEETGEAVLAKAAPGDPDREPIVSEASAGSDGEAVETAARPRPPRPNGGRRRVRVSDYAGHPIAGLTVSVEDRGGRFSPEGRAVTDREGVALVRVD